MINRLPPPRPKAHSQPDAEVPESVYQALLGVQKSVEGVATEMRAGFAAQAITNAELREEVKNASAHSVERWTNLAKALVPAVIAIVGGTVGVQKLTEPEPQRTRVSESALSAELVKCQAKPEAEQRYCVADAYEADKVRRNGGRP
jgi:hypothetical protein